MLERAAPTFSSLPDRIIVTLLAGYGIVVLGVLLLGPFRFLPAEDAVILHQYSKNFAAHGAITYYAGGPKVEGATDFGWMLIVAIAMRMGFSPMGITSVLNAVSLICLGFTLLRLARIPWTFFRILAVAGAAGLVPQIVASVSGFDVLPEACLLTLLVVATLEQQVVRSSVLALLLCLLRPDGVLFAVPLLLSLLTLSGKRRQRVNAMIGLFLLPGILYFSWRVHYFGEWLPLPFIVKADVHRSLGVLVPHSVTQSLKYLFVDGVLLVPLARRGCLRLFLLVPLLAVPTIFYWTMRLDQNVGDRFFFYLPLAGAVLVATCWGSLELAQRKVLLRTATAAFVILMLGPLWREVRSFRDYQFQNVQEIAAGLGQLPSRGSMLTSEAGYLAYGSDWTSYDAWGLDTARFAKHFIQPADVVSLTPDLIVLHPDIPGDCVPKAQWPQSYVDRSWEHMIRNVAIGAQVRQGAQKSRTYELWYLTFGSEFYRTRKHWNYGEGDQECFFLSRSSMEYQGMVSLLERHHARPASEEGR